MAATPLFSSISCLCDIVWSICDLKPHILAPAIAADWTLDKQVIYPVTTVGDELELRMQTLARDF